MFNKLNDLLSIVVGGFTGIWDALSTPMLVLFEQHSNGFTRFLINLIEGLNVTQFFADYTLGSFVFGSSLLFLVVVFVIYMFIP